MVAINYSEIFNSLWNDIDEKTTYPNARPILAHYTSIDNVENILRTDEIWFSNPLNMNDYEELRYVVLEANSMFYENNLLINAFKKPEELNSFQNHFKHFFDKFSNQHCLDVYAFCFSEYAEADVNGLLSMWRGYGGNGKGAALVIDTSKIEPKEDSPFIIAKVTYLSKESRINWIENTLNTLATIIENNELDDDGLYHAAYYLFERIKIFALFTKHNGFDEEKEWRVVYLNERNKDPEVEKMLGYAKTNRGLEPKLKFKFKSLPSITTGEFSISSVTHKIILGPSFSTPMSKSTFEKMLILLGKPELINKVSVSDIPFRPL